MSRNDRRSHGHEAPHNLEAIANIPKSIIVEELRSLLPTYSIIAVPLTYLLRNKVFASKRARKMPIEWIQQRAHPSEFFKRDLSSRLRASHKWYPHRCRDRHNSSSPHQGAHHCVGESPIVLIGFKSRSKEQKCIYAIYTTYAILHFRHNLTGRRFTFVTECSDLTWLLRAGTLATSSIAGHSDSSIS